MVELRDVEIKRNLGRSVQGNGGDSLDVSREAVAGGSGSEAGGGTGAWRSSGMSRGEAITAYEAVARDNERLEKEVTRLRTEVRLTFIYSPWHANWQLLSSWQPRTLTEQQAKSAPQVRGPNFQTGLAPNLNPNLQRNLPNPNALDKI
jgi:hypothetical protein